MEQIIIVSLIERIQRKRLYLNTSTKKALVSTCFKKRLNLTLAFWLLKESLVLKRHRRLLRIMTNIEVNPTTPQTGACWQNTHLQTNLVFASVIDTSQVAAPMLQSTMQMVLWRVLDATSRTIWWLLTTITMISWQMHLSCNLLRERPTIMAKAISINRW